MSTAHILKSNKGKILKNWLQKVQQEMPIILKHDKSAIENSVPDLLDAIILQIESEGIEKIQSNSRLHGAQRTSFSNYSLRHVIKEYNILKSEILHLLDTDQITEPKDRDDIMFMVDHAIEEAAETFFMLKQGVLIKARKVAEQKANELEIEDENREEFIQSITHDLNNPLSNIKGCISLLEMDLDVEKIGKILNILKTSAQQAEFLVKDFLDVGKVNLSEKFPIKRSSFEIIDELENQIEVYRISHNRDVEFDPKVADVYVSIDLDLLRRSVGNLMNNALKHGNSDSKITVSCYLEQGMVVIAVQNTGKMIPQENLKNIFNRYYQGDGTTKGWGIGLAFVNEVVKAHGGEAVVESNEEKGTTFKLIFPHDDIQNHNKKA